MAVDKKAIDGERRGKYFKPHEGNNFIFLMPPTEGRTKPWAEVYMHYGIGINNISVVCPNKMRNERCPLCEKSKKLYNENTEESKKMAKKFWPKMTWYAAVIDVEDPDLKVQPWRFGIQVKKYLVDCFYDDEDPDTFIDYTDLKKGYKVVLKRTDKSSTENYVEYSAKLGKEFSFDKEKIAEIQENMPVLSKFAECLTYREIVELMNTSEYADEEEEGTEEVASVGNDTSATTTAKESKESKLAEDDDKELDGKEEKKEPEKTDKKTTGHPRCFGKEYSTDDDECLECRFETDCADIVNKASKKK